MKAVFLLFLSLQTLAAVDINSTIDKGLKYLVENQRPDGSFGAARRTKASNIYAPGPGAHLTFKATTSALCLMALVQENKSPVDVRRAVTRCTAFLLKNHEAVRRVDGRWVGNVWGHAYILKAMLRVREKEYMKDSKDKIDECIQFQIKQLKRYQYADGGWGYYDFKYQTNSPSGSSTSFLIATVLISLKEAKEAGFEIDDKMVKRGVFQLNRQKRPDNCFLYSSDFHFYKGRGINKPQGSVGRNQGCLKALYIWEAGGIKQEFLSHWVGKIIELDGWLDMGRKRPLPHESWYEVAGYFYYYGYYYAGENLENCADNKKEYAAKIAKTLSGHQEKDGSWFDFPLYDYGHYYGTAYALMTLQQCRRHMK